MVKNPYDVTTWFNYITETKSWPPLRHFALYKRALYYLPGSYKIWHAYLQEFVLFMKDKHPEHPGWHALDKTFATSVECLANCVRICEEWITFVLERGWWTRAIDVLDACLRRVPATQHWRLWEAFVTVGCSGEDEKTWGIPKVGIRIMKRWCVLDPTKVNGLFEAYVEAGEYNEAVTVAGKVLQVGGLIEDKCKDRERLKLDVGTKARLWRRMIDVGVEHSTDITVNVPLMIKEGINEAKAEVGELWVKLGEFYLRRGDFDRARKTYQDAVDTIFTVHDFAVVYDAWTKFEEGLVTSLLELAGDGDDTEIEAGLARLEELTASRPELLSSVMLRQNPHNVHEWHKRAGLYKELNDPAKVVECYTKAVKKVDPWRATHGRSHTLWLAFAQYYEAASVPESARQVFDKAVSDPEHFRIADDLAAVWCEYAEMELRLGSPKKSRDVLLRATKEPSAESLSKNRRQSKVRNRNNAVPALALGTGKHSRGLQGIKGVSYDYSKPSIALESWKSPRVWSFLCELTLSNCDIDVCIDLYNSMLDKKVATPALVLHSAEHLLSLSYFNAGFDLLDRATKIFPFPTVLPLWVFYLERFISHYKHTKLERTRHILSMALGQLKKAPRFAESALATKILHLARVKFELEYGSPRLAMTALSEATEAVDNSDKLLLYKLYIERASELWGTTRTRRIYEQALTNLGGREGLEIAARFAKTEEALGEIVRARNIYSYGTQCLLEGHVEADWYWHAWRSFELERGDEDTFRDMLRVKRSIEQRMPSRILAAVNSGVERKEQAVLGEEQEPGIAALEREVQREAVENRDIDEGGREETVHADEGEIALDLDGVDDEDEVKIDEVNKGNSELDQNINVQNEASKMGGMLKIGPEARAAMKDAVLKAAGLEDMKRTAKEASDASDGNDVGALERFKRRKATSGIGNA